MRCWRVCQGACCWRLIVSPSHGELWEARRVPKRRPSDIALHESAARRHCLHIMSSADVAEGAPSAGVGAWFHGLCLLVSCVLCPVGLSSPSKFPLSSYTRLSSVGDGSK